MKIILLQTCLKIKGTQREFKTVKIFYMKKDKLRTLKIFSYINETKEHLI